MGPSLEFDKVDIYIYICLVYLVYIWGERGPVCLVDISEGHSPGKSDTLAPVYINMSIISLPMHCSQP